MPTIHGPQTDLDRALVEVHPRKPTAAAFTAAVDGDVVTITAGKTWFEVFSIKTVDDLGYIGQIAAAVFAGNMEEAGLFNRFARIRLADGRTVSVGVVHLPLPWV
jgi:hypothetical protein